MQLPRSTDVVIVGAGPAGTATARLLAGSGHDVVLLDRRSFPREKPCGDCLSAEATRILQRLGLLDRVLAKGPARLRGWRIVAPDGHGFTATYDDSQLTHSISLRRAILDAVLLDGAREAGAAFFAPVQVTDLERDRVGHITGVRVRSGDAAHTIRARLTIGADGLRSIVARRLGLVERAPVIRKLSLGMHIPEATGLGDLGELHLADGACAGFAPVWDPHGTAPPPPGSAEPPTAAGTAPTANLTIVVDSRRYARDVARGRDAFYRTMINRFPRLAGRVTLPDAEAGRLDLRASGPFDWPTRDVVADGAALVGDAAGYYDPLTGQGIIQALASAELLAEEADVALRSSDLSSRRLRRYAKRRRAYLREMRLLQRAIEFVIAHPVRANFALRRLAHAPTAAAAIITVTSDLRPARSLLSPRIAFDLLLSSSRSETIP